ncbi:MAG: hypothetical protein ACYCS7_07965 [Acidimicrobiales bacterium]
MSTLKARVISGVVVALVLGGILGAIAATGGPGSGGGGSGGGSGSSTTSIATSFTLPSPPTTEKREMDVPVVSGSGNLHMVETASGPCTGTFVSDLALTVPPTSLMPSGATPNGAVTINTEAEVTWQSSTGASCNFGNGTIVAVPPTPPQSHQLQATVSLALGIPTAAQVSLSGALATQNTVNSECSKAMATSHGIVAACNVSLQLSYTGAQGLSSGASKLKCTPSSMGQTALSLSNAPPTTAKPTSCKISPSSTYTGTLELAGHPCFNGLVLPGEVAGCVDTGSLSLKVKVEKLKYRSAPALIPGQVTFPLQTDGTTATAQVFTMTNEPVANAPLLVAALGITGSAHEKFPVSADHCTGAILQPGQSCTFAVAFAPGPSDNGFEDATLKVITDAKVGTYTSALYGTAAPAPTTTSSNP